MQDTFDFVQIIRAAFILPLTQNITKGQSKTFQIEGTAPPVCILNGPLLNVSIGKLTIIPVFQMPMTMESNLFCYEFINLHFLNVTV